MCTSVSPCQQGDHRAAAAHGGVGGGAAEQSARGRGKGLTLAHFRAQLEDLRDTSPTIELKLSTFGTHPRVNLGHMGDKGSSSCAERGTVSSS